MTPNLNNDTSQGQVAADALRSWVMVVLTLIFVILYGAALIGWLKPLANDQMITRLEPIIFVIIGYYFGRLPAQQNEKTLKEEVTRQTKKADAAQHAKEQAQQVREALEEKVKNAKAALAPAASLRNMPEGSDVAGRDDFTRSSVAAAINVLNS